MVEELLQRSAICYQQSASAIRNLLPQTAIGYPQLRTTNLSLIFRYLGGRQLADRRLLKRIADSRLLIAEAVPPLSVIPTE